MGIVDFIVKLSYFHGFLARGKYITAYNLCKQYSRPQTNVLTADVSVFYDVFELAKH